MNIAKNFFLTEKQHSLVGFHKEIIFLFNDFYKKGELEEKNEKGIEEKKVEEKLQYYINMPFSFENILFNTAKENKENKENLERREVSEDERDDQDACAEEKNKSYEFYKKNMFVLGKNLYFFKSVIMKICHNNIDDIVVEKFNNIDDIKAAFIWLNIDVHDFRKANIQDKNKLENLLKSQILKECHKKGRDLQFNVKNKFSKEVLNELWGRPVEEQRRDLQNYKNKARIYLDRIFNVYKKLNNYLEFALNTDIGDLNHVKNNADLHDLINNKESIEKIILLSEALRQALIKYFMTFVKVDELNLPHTDLSHADFNHTDFSGGSYINTTARFANLTYSVWHDCDLSICDFTSANATSADFSNSNFSYANLVGVTFKNANLTNCQFNSALFRSPKMDTDISNIKKLTANASYNKEISKINNTELLDIIAGKMAEKKNNAKNIRERLEKENIDIDDYCGGSMIRKEFLNKLNNEKENENSEFLQSTIQTSTDADKAITLITNENNGETLIDNPFRMFQALITDFITLHDSKVISPEFRKILWDVEKIEKPQDKEDRISHCGEMSMSIAEFQKANLAGSSMPGLDLSHLNFSNATADGADLNNSQIYFSNFTQSSCVSTNFSKSVFYKSNFLGASLSKANLIQSILIDCNLRNVNFSETLVLDTIFLNSNCDKPYLSRILTRGKGSKKEDRFFDVAAETPFAKTDYDMQESNFTNAVGSGTSFINVNLDKSRFDRADFKMAKIFNCSMRWAFMNHCDLTYAAIIGVAFQQSQMKSLTLSRARLYSVEFSGTQLSDATIVSGKIDKTLFHNTEIAGSNLSNTSFNNCIFRDVNFDDVNLSNVYFSNVAFCRVSFENCKGLESAIFKRCIFFDCYNTEGNKIANESPMVILRDDIKINDEENDKYDATGTFKVYTTD